MLTRIFLDVLAVSASTLAVVLAMFQVEDGHLSRVVLWVAFALLAVVVTAETIDLVRAVPLEWSAFVPPEEIRPIFSQTAR